MFGLTCFTYTAFHGSILNTHTQWTCSHFNIVTFSPPLSSFILPQQLHLIDSFIIALLMMTFPILSVQLFSSLWFQLLIILHHSALIWWGSQQSYCFPHSQLLLSALSQSARYGLHVERQIISKEEATNILTHQQKTVTDISYKRCRDSCKNKTKTHTAQNIH